ncbi:MAG: helix-turn-helix domain-containing protein [Bilophila wadsworthia]
MKTYIDKLRALREDNDLTQEQIATLLHTSQTMYARYERGANELPLRHFLKLCVFYNMSADDLLDIQLDKNRSKGEASKKALKKTCRATREKT